MGFLPQFPQTLTNSIIVTAALALQLYPEQADRISERRLLISLGVGNLLVPFIGGFPYCHGSGGMAAHYRFGGRTMFTPLIIGSILFLMSIVLGPGAIEMMALIPTAILGCLLFYSGVELLSIRPQSLCRLPVGIFLHFRDGHHQPGLQCRSRLFCRPVSLLFN